MNTLNLVKNCQGNNKVIMLLTTVPLTAKPFIETNKLATSRIIANKTI